MAQRAGRVTTYTRLREEHFKHDEWPEGCTCPRQLDAFDVIAAHELARPLTLTSLWQENMQLMFVNNAAEYVLDLTKNLEGVYIIWQNLDFCPEHHHQVSRAVYGGKGMLDNRLKVHYAQKKFEWDYVGVTYKKMPNRMAKYIEQLLLDLYRPDFNSQEVRGTRALLSCWDDDLLDSIM